MARTWMACHGDAAVNRTGSGDREAQIAELLDRRRSIRYAFALQYRPVRIAYLNNASGTSPPGSTRTPR